MKKVFIVLFALVLGFTSFFVAGKIDTTYADEFNYNAKSYLLMDYNTGQVLLEQNAEERFEVASMVKLMTMLITLEKLEAGELDMDTMVSASGHACSMEGSQAFLDPGSEYKISELLKSVIIASANDSSVVLAECIGGSEASFTDMMNKRAKELGMKNTSYANATGLPAAEQYSTALDTAIVLKEVMKNSDYYKYSSIWMDTFKHPSGRETELVNTNRLTRFYNGCNAGKTGYTDEAGYCLSASAKRGDMRLISVVVGAKSSKDRFAMSTDILNFGFANYKNQKLLSEKEPLGEKIAINGGYEGKLQIKPERDCYVIVKKGSEDSFELKYDIPSYLNAPIKKGEKVGTVYVIENGKVVDEVSLLAIKDCNKINYKQSMRKVMFNW